MGRQQDYLNPQTINAEAKVIDFLLATLPGWEILDQRHLKIHRDIVIFNPQNGKRFSVDVKLDGLIDRTQRVLFEDYALHDNGRIERGWGRDSELDFLAVVGRTSGRIWFVSLPQLRKLVRKNANGEQYPATWARNRKRVDEDGMTTFGYAVPIVELQSFNHAACVQVGRVAA